MFVKVDILGDKKQNNGDREIIVYTATLMDRLLRQVVFVACFFCTWRVELDVELLGVRRFTALTWQVLKKNGKQKGAESGAEREWRRVAFTIFRDGNRHSDSWRLFRRYLK